jgi:hypothetical protein
VRLWYQRAISLQGNGRLELQIMMKPKRRVRVNVLALEQSERYFARADALMAGAVKVMSEWMNGTSWGPEIAIDVASQLLEEARQARASAMAVHDGAYQRLGTANAKPKSRKRSAGGKAITKN